MNSEDIDRVWEEAQKEHEVVHKMGQDHVDLAAQTIGNLAALRLLSDESIEDTVKNL